jgi:hypothetical protein
VAAREAGPTKLPSAEQQIDMMEGTPTDLGCTILFTIDLLTDKTTI